MSTDTNNSKTRILRGFLGLILLFAVFVTVGSYFMRAQVIKALSYRASSSASTVLSRPYPIRTELNLKDSNLLSRLKRLRYRMRSELPTSPGEYMKDKRSLNIFLREFMLPDGKHRKARPIRIELTPNGDFVSIFDTESRIKIPYAWLEPEYVSLLGSSSTRVSTPKPLSSYPKHLVDSVLSIEDERFYGHFGLDPVAIMRAVLANLKSGSVVQGGSTITQQLAKNLFFSSARTLTRKIYEAFSALLIETAFTKNQILEFYLNEIFLGQEGRVAIHGFGEAAQSFFGKDLGDLNLAESATLAGIIKAPSTYSPRHRPEAAEGRRGVVLKKLLERGLITKEQHQKSKKVKLKVKPARRLARPAAYFVDAVRKEVNNPGEQPINVNTGLDMEYQTCAENAVSSGLGKIEKRFKKIRRMSKKSPLQAALVAIDPVSGIVRAWVGGRNYGKNQFNRVSQAQRQPGSAFKPFVYLTALDTKLNTYRTARTTSLLADEPLSMKVPGGDTWRPQNYDRKYRGEVTLREALTRSLNIPTVNLALKVGIEKVARTAELFGFGDNLPVVPSLALGAGEVSPLELARAYAAIANGGKLPNIRSIVSVSTADAILHKNPYQLENAASEPATYVLTNILQSVIEEGTAKVVRRLGFNSPAAGKTGTSNDGRDSWFAGFTPRLLAVVWVGFDDNRAHGLTGSQAAAPIWAEFMKCVEPMEPSLNFIAPRDVIFKKVDTDSGLLATPSCPNSRVITEVFVKGADPITPCPLHSRQRREVVKPPSRQSLPPARRPEQRGIWDSLFGY